MENGFDNYLEREAGFKMFIEFKRDLLADAQKFATDVKNNPTAVIESNRVEYYITRLDEIGPLWGKDIDFLKMKLVDWATKEQRANEGVFRGIQEYLRAIFRNRGIEI